MSGVCGRRGLRRRALFSGVQVRESAVKGLTSHILWPAHAGSPASYCHLLVQKESNSAMYGIGSPRIPDTGAVGCMSVEMVVSLLSNDGAHWLSSQRAAELCAEIFRAGPYAVAPPGRGVSGYCSEWHQLLERASLPVTGI